MKKEQIIEELLQVDEKIYDPNDPILLKNVTKKFGDFTAVDDLTISIKENEIFTILGHNGAGKTTAINMMTGLLKLTSGEISVYGNKVTTEIEEV